MNADFFQIDDNNGCCIVETSGHDGQGVIDVIAIRIFG